MFRIGINIGDVMVSQDNLYGDAVNIAARLEAEAKPDGICISKSVLDMVSRKIQVSYQDAGELVLKNIEHPVQAYFVIQKRGAERYVQHTEAPRVKVERAEAGPELLPELLPKKVLLPRVMMFSRIPGAPKIRLKSRFTAFFCKISF